MNTHIILEFINLFFSGILAGSLFVIDYGIRTPLSSIEQQPQIQMRKALIYRLRILIPATFVPTIISGIAVVIVCWSEPGYLFRFAGMLALLTCFTTTLLGTAPINKAILKWKAEAPPQDWKAQVSRWERLDTARTWIGVASFLLMLATILFERSQ